MSQSKPTLKLDWCSYEAAKYAVEHWHYSRTMPVGKMARIGVWEEGGYIGALVFSSSACPWLGSPYGLTQFETCELVRVAIRTHKLPVSRIGSIAIRLLRQLAPRLRLIVSYADPEFGHHGGIYQAMGWVYVGTSSPKWTANGQHNRAFGTSVAKAKQRLGTGVTIRMHEPKYKYLMPLDPAMRAQVLPLAKPYPKRATSIGSDASGVQPDEGGAVPTVALQDSGNG